MLIFDILCNIKNIWMMNLTLYDIDVAVILYVSILKMLIFLLSYF